jgi:predicted phosphodiesterase
LTRLAVLADVHGNLPALEAVEADFERIGVDHVVVAGDLAIGAPFTRRVVERALERGWALIRGNNEIYVTDFGSQRARPEWNDPVQFSVLRWAVRELGELRRLIAAWPDGLVLRYPDAPPVRVVHGSPRSPFEGLTPIAPEETLIERIGGVEENLVVAAHTHLTMDRRVGRWRVLNPGSAGQPLDGCLEAGYMLLEARDGRWHPTVRRVSYDVERVLAECERRAYVDECGPIGALVVEEQRTARSRVSPFLRWRAETCPDEPISFDLLARFREVDVWRYTSAHFLVNR